MRRYRSEDDDSARWAGFPYREGDVVISTRSKSGTTWMQMICALLVLDTPDLPAPLSELSPWVDHAVESVADVVARLQAQQHRRFVKTHTPLDGLPLDDRATYIVVARHPLDMALSLYHQGDNLDRKRLAELTGVPARVREPRSDAHDWLVAWTRSSSTALEQPDSPAGVVHHVRDAWDRAATRSNVVLVHYADLLADLPGQMAALAGRLGLSVTAERVATLARAASFEAMRSRSAELAPDTLGVLRDTDAFFRSGRSGAGRELLTAKELAAYEARVAPLAPPEVLAWLHR
ncbi:MAG TPA: sulfotransferase domain-containing protein [Nocardioidaceae bacterium]|nr:sulfotransferase domain-containing protein [Nocardioidaceae bacterium]